MILDTYTKLLQLIRNKDVHVRMCKNYLLVYKESKTILSLPSQTKILGARLILPPTIVKYNYTLDNLGQKDENNFFLLLNLII